MFRATRQLASRASVVHAVSRSAVTRSAQHNTFRAFATASYSHDGHKSSSWTRHAGMALGAAVVGGLTLYTLPTAHAHQPQSYKEKVVANYENRIRAMSAPEKVFELFASVNNEDGQFMTPADFMRAITPYWSSDDNDKVKMSDFKYIRLCDTNDDGLLDFPEYMFFVTLLSIPKAQFSIAFKMFDLDGNGTVDQEEFKQVLAVMRQRAPQGSQQRTAAVEKGGLFTAFFGEDGSKKLSADKFSEFLEGLQLEVRRLQFNNLGPNEKGLITPADFARSVVAFGLVRHIDEYMNRIEKLLDDEAGTISWDDYKDFHEVISHMDQLTFAMALVNDAGRGVSKSDFARAVKVTTGVELSNAVIDVVYRIFDLNQDGHFQIKDFSILMRHANRYGLDKPRDVGFVRWVSRVWECARE